MSIERVELKNASDSDSLVTVYNTSDAYGDTVLFEEAVDQHEGYFSLKFDDLMQGLHDLGYDVQGWEPKVSLEERVLFYLANSHEVADESRVATIIKMIKEDQNG